MKQVLRFLALAALLAAPWGGYFNQVQAQQTVLSEDFNSMSSIPTTYSSNGWFAYNAGSGNNWTLSSSDGVGSSKCAKYAYSSSYAANCYLVSTPFAVGASLSELSVSLKQKVQSASYAETFEVFFVKASDITDLASVASATPYEAIASASYTNTSYSERTGSSTSSELAGQNVRLVIHCTSIADRHTLFIDDITVTFITTDPWISLAPISATVLTGSTQSLTATYGNVTGTPTITYTSDNTSVATVSGSGTTATVTAVAPGTATITATMNGTQTATCDITVEDPHHCTPTLSGSYTTYYISNFTTTGGTTNINNTTTGTGLSYSDFYASHSASAYEGQTINFTITIAGGSTYGSAIWVDWDNDYEFSSEERVYHTTSYASSPHSGSFTVPVGTTLGDHRMRVVSDYNGSNPSNPCSANTGEFEDYKLTITAVPSCLPPTGLEVVENSETINSVQLQWTQGSETAWDVYCTTSTDAPTAETTPTVTATSDNPCTVDGLTHSSHYYAYVRSNCGSEHSAWTLAVEFNTACAAITAVGYSQNFDGISIASAYTPTARTLPTCWKYINECTYSSYKYYPTIYYYSSTDYSHTSPNCLRFYSYYDSWTNYDPHPQYAILPEMTDLSGKQVTLWAKGYYASSTFKIGTMSDPTDTSTFTLIREQALTTSYQQFEYIIPSTTDAYLAIMIDSATSSRTTNGVYIDDISISEPPACPKPTGLARSNVAAHTVDLSWMAGYQESAWQICINNDEENLVSIDENDVTITGSSVSYTLTGLDPEMAHTVKVRANCGGSDGVSQWSNEVSFTTTVACPAPTSPSNHDITAHTATLKWIGNATSSNYEVKYRTAAGVDLNTSVLDEDFTGLTTGIPTGWDNSEGTTTTDSYKWNYYGSGNGTGPCVRFNSYNNSDGKTNFLKTPAMDFPAGETMTLTFWWKNPAGDDFSVYISTDGGTTKTPLKSGMTSQSSWKQEFISLSDYVGATNVTIHFKGTSNCGYGDAYIYLDDIVIGEEIPAGEWQTVAPANITVTPGTYVGAASLSGLLAETKYEAYVRTDCNAAGDGYSTTQLDFTPFTTDIACKKPTTLAADATGATTVTLSWTNGEAGQTAWVIAHKAEGAADFTEVAADANPFTVEGLTPGTTYSFKVRANCTAASDGYSDWSDLLENVETQAACPTPVLAANGITNITDNSATVTWTGFAENQDFVVSYRTAATMGTPIFTEDFSSGIGEWTMSNCNASTGVNNEAFRFRWTTTPPQYLISPEISGIDAEAILEFQYKDDDFTELFQVGYSTTDNNVSSFTFGAEIATPKDQTWHTYHGTLPAGTKYISIKCNSDDQFYLYVDDIVIASEVAAGGWQTVSPNPTTTTTTITGLTPETKYDVKVQANCALSQTSEESEVRSFTTYYGATLDVTANSWYAIASPVHNSGNNETVAGVDNLIATDPVKYDFLRYNEQYAKWESQKDDGFDAMERGRGHIYRRSAATTLKFIGERNTGNITYFCQGASSGTMKGWNLIGNPYPHAITRAHISQAYGYLVDGYYTLQASGSWRAEASTTAPIAVGQAILVKVTSGGNVTFSETAPSTKSAPASTIAFTVSNDEFTDIAYARFSSEEGLPKISHLNPEAPMLSIDGYAIANLNEGTESFPMSFSGQGSYTLTVSGNTDVTGYLHLVDRATGRDIDLLSTPSYSFTGSPVSDRFTVKLTPDANEGNSTTRFAIFDGNSLVINGEGTLEVYDVMGRRLMSAEVTGSEYRIPSSDLHTGVYVLRMNGNSQKIVIK